MLIDAPRSVRRSPSRHQQGNQRDIEENGNDDDGLPGEFDGDKPDDLLAQVQGNKSSAPVTYRTSRNLHNPWLEREEKATSAPRSTEQVGRLSFFRMPTDASEVRWGSGS